MHRWQLHCGRREARCGVELLLCCNWVVGCYFPWGFNSIVLPTNRRRSHKLWTLILSRRHPSTKNTYLKLIKNQETSKLLNQLVGYVLDPRRAKKKVAVFPLTKIAFTKIGYSLEHMILDDTSASVTNGILALVILRLVLLSSKMQKCYKLCYLWSHSLHLCLPALPPHHQWASMFPSFLVPILIHLYWELPYNDFSINFWAHKYFPVLDIFIFPRSLSVPSPAARRSGGRDLFQVVLVSSSPRLS